MLFKKELTRIDENDLQMLVDNIVREGREIEYKEVLNIYTEEQKQEFLNDVSSFANASGGYLIYGIRESKQDSGVPVEVCGLKGENPGKKTIDMENIIFTGVEPRLRGVTIIPVPLPSHDERIAIVLHIPKSYAAPHMVKSSGRFYSRNSVGKFPLDVLQLRNAFELAGTTAERIRSFRVERLSKLSAGEDLPVAFDVKAPKLVLHVIPLNTFDNTNSVDLAQLNNAPYGDLLRPLLVWDLEANVETRFNLDGFVRINNRAYNSDPVSYTQVFRNGIIETADISILGIHRWSINATENIPEAQVFNGERYERKLVETTKRLLEVQSLLNIDSPFLIMVSLLGVKGYRIIHPRFENGFTESTKAIDRANLFIPEIIIENNVSLAEAMKPIFDTIWNAAGREGSLNYDESGRFTYGY